ncbi:hypothetical protein BC833DRAFT_36026 [Globomyces pollinis-pini]|nr:hypothetical protein BC833DRAFT_36026 [Globomyces pollinis-pini]
MVNILNYLNGLHSTTDNFPKLMHILNYISTNHPSAFQSLFEQLVDILIGWAVDPLTPKSTQTLVFENLPSYWMYWLQHVDYGVSLLENLLNDLQNALGIDCHPENDDEIVKIDRDSIPTIVFALLQSIHSVLYSILKASFSQLNELIEYSIQSNNIYYSQLNNVMIWLLRIWNAISFDYTNREWIIEIYKQLKFILVVSQRDSIIYKKSFQYIQDHLDVVYARFESSSDCSEINELVTVLSETFKHYKIIYSIEFKDQFLNPKSKLLSTYRLAVLDNQSKITNLLATCSLIAEGEQSSMNVSVNGPFLLETETLFRRIYDLSQSSDEQIIDGFELLNEQQIIHLVVFNISFISSFANRNAIGYNAILCCQFISKFYNTLCKSCLISREWWSLVEGTLISSLYKIYVGNEFFLPRIAIGFNSTFDNMDLVQSQFFILEQLATSNNYGRICLGLTWIGEIVEFLKHRNVLDTDVNESFTLTAVETSLIGYLKIISVERDSEIRKKVADVWNAYLNYFSLNRRGSSNTNVIQEMFLQRLHDINPEVSSSFFRCFANLDPFDSLLALHDLPSMTNKMDYEDQFKSMVISCPALGTFRGRQFLQVVSYLGMGSFAMPVDEAIIAQTGPGTHIRSWLPDLYASTQTETVFRNMSIPNVENVLISVSISLNLQMFWALWETARYCVYSRLKTTFGGPLTTLESIEKTLNTYDLIFADFKAKPESFSSEIYLDLLQRRTNLLHFIDLLEIQILSTANGSLPKNCPTPSKHCILFFHTNLNVCQDWFARIRSRCAQNAAGVSENRIAIYHGAIGLSDKMRQAQSSAIKNQDEWNRETRHCLMSIYKALMEMKDSDSIKGLLAFWKRNTKSVPNSDQMFSDLFAKEIPQFLSLGRLYVEGHLEQAVKNQLVLYDSFEDVFTKPEIHSDIKDQILDCYVGLNDWKSAAKVFEKFSEGSLEPIPEKFNFEKSFLTFWSLVHNRQLSEHAKISPNLMCLDILDKGISKVLKETSQRFLFNMRPDAIHAPQEIQSVLNNLQSIASISMFTSFKNNTERLLYCHSILSFAGFEKKGERSNTIRFGKSNPKERLIHATLKGEYLKEWVGLYNFARFGESFGLMRKARDPDLDEIGGLIAELSRKTKNFQLAKTMLNTSQSSLTTSAALRHTFKHALLLEEENQGKEALSLLLDVLNMPLDKASTTDLEIKSQACHLFALWNDPPIVSFDDLDHLQTIESTLGETLSDDDSFSISSDLLSLKFLKKSTVFAPFFPRSWYLYGSFCYKMGRQMLNDLSNNLSSKFCLNELKSLAEILEKSANSQFYKPIILSLLVEMGETHESSSSSHLNWRTHPEFTMDALYDIENILQTIRIRIFQQFENAANAYFEYLLVDQKDTRSKGNLASLKGDVLTTTLRLIRIFVLYGVALQNTFKDKFVTTPIPPWKNVIPQLFSRLTHPEPLVREEITKLLCRIGVEYPHLVIYPTLLGSKDKMNASSEQNPYVLIIDSLIKRDVNLVNDMRVWISELQRVTVLWEEMWQYGLDHLKAEVVARASKLQRDISRIKANNSLHINEQSEIIESTITNMMKPVFFLVEKLCESTYRKGAVTQHEKRFKELYVTKIETALQNLVALRDFSNPQGLFVEFQEILQEMNKDTKSTLSLKSLSPYLSSMEHTRIHIPGLELNELILVTSCKDTIKLLPTKTKPKKIELLASNGNSYSYLLKGHEDLHLDERIQQFVQIVNVIFGSTLTTSSRNLTAQTYNVIPFGENFGMIQWIENAQGMFSLFRKWQYWDHTAKSLQKKDMGNNTAHPQRPIENFMSKINQAVKQGKLDKNSPRQKWPLTVLKEVFLELQKETPSDIISNEIWTASISNSNWWTKTVSFARSTAVMSVVGYVLGLGDRHLDNILVDPQSGQIIHIDFNVCFEKGRTLRIPELVPFRLTQNLVKAFGPFGVDGAFRIACEEALWVMRDNREILLTLLEAFIYDPLVDWTKQNSGEKQVLNLNVNIGLLTSRINELNSSLNDSSIELPVHISIIQNECFNLKKSLSSRETFQTQLNSISSLTVESATAELVRLHDESEKTKVSFAEKISDFHTTHLRHKTMLMDFKTTVNEILAYEESYQSIPYFPISKSKKLREDEISLLSASNNQIKDLQVIRTELFSQFLTHLQWYYTFMHLDVKVFVGQDFYARYYSLLSDVVEKEFSTNACKFGLHGIKNSLVVQNIKKIKLLAEMQTVLIAEQDDVEHLESLLVDLKQRADKKLPADLSQLLSTIESTSDIPFLDLSAVLILSEIGRLAYAVAKGENIQSSGVQFFGSEYEFLCNVYEGIYRRKSTSNASMSQESYQCAILIGICKSCLAVVNRESLKEDGRLVIDQKLIDEFDTFDQTQTIIANYIRRLISDLIPLVLKSFARRISSVHLLITELINIGQECQPLLMVDAKSNSYKSEARRLHDKFDGLNTLLFENDVEAIEIFEFLSAMIKSLSHGFKQGASGDTLFIRFLSVLGSFFQDAIKCILKSSLIEIDPTAEFIVVFGSRTLLQHRSDFAQSKKALDGFLSLILREAFLKPFINLISKVLGSIEAQMGPIGPKSWGSVCTFPENTTIGFVDKSRKILNHAIRNQYYKLEDLNEAKDSICKKSISILSVLIHDRGLKRKTNIEFLLDSKKNSVAKYQQIHARNLFDEMGDLPVLQPIHEFNAGILKAMNSLGDYSELLLKQKDLQTQLVAKLANSSNGKSVLNLKSFESILEKQLSVIDAELMRNENLIEFCSDLSNFETCRLQSPKSLSLISELIMQLETIIHSERRLAAVKKDGFIDGSLADIKSSLASLNIPESIEYLEKLIHKLSGFISNMKKMVEPVLRIAENIVNYAKGTVFNTNVLKSLMMTRKRWKKIRDRMSDIQESFASFESNQETAKLTLIEKCLAEIKVEAQYMFTTLSSFSELQNISEKDVITIEHDVECTIPETDDTLRLNKEQKKNATAVNMLLRIKSKLEGCDNADHKRLSVEDQVEWLIEEATNVDHLACMYEGWMSWF